jgi:hypothetical protein
MKFLANLAQTTFLIIGKNPLVSYAVIVSDKTRHILKLSYKTTQGKRKAQDGKSGLKKHGKLDLKLC